MLNIMVDKLKRKIEINDLIVYNKPVNGRNVIFLGIVQEIHNIYLLVNTIQSNSLFLDKIKTRKFKINNNIKVIINFENKNKEEYANNILIIQKNFKYIEKY